MSNPQRVKHRRNSNDYERDDQQHAGQSVPNTLVCVFFDAQQITSADVTVLELSRFARAI